MTGVKQMGENLPLHKVVISSRQQMMREGKTSSEQQDPYTCPSKFAPAALPFELLDFSLTGASLEED